MTRNAFDPQHSRRFRPALCAIFATALVLSLAAGTAEAGRGSRSRQAAEPAAASLQAPAALVGPKRSVSVARFSVKSDFEALYGGTDLGGGLSAMLITALSESGRFIVVERPDLGTVLSEQQLTTAGVVATEGSPGVGRLLGSQFVIVGHLTEFSEEAAGSGFSIGVSLGGSRNRGLGLSPQKRVGTVGIDVRVLDTTTGEVIASYYVRETVKARSIAAKVRFDQVDLGKQRVKKTPLGEAARQAIRQVVARFAAEMTARPWEGRVVDVEGGEIAINAGSDAGIEAGDRLSVVRVGKVLTDPTTGRVLGSRKREIAQIVVTEVHDELAFAELAEGSGSVAQRGDLVLGR